MNRDELLKALRRIKTPDEHRCFGCGYEDNCSIHGCAVIRAAMEEIMQLAVENTAMQRKLSPEDAEACKRPMSQSERDALLEWPPQPYPNPPLTLEQLREMEGEPVWISAYGINRYDVFTGFSTDELAKFYRDALPLRCYGDTWLAYRRKPEEAVS